MADATLVVHELTPELRRAAADLLAVLDREQIPVTAAFWRLDDDEFQWRLVLASPEVEQHGPRAFYDKVGERLRAEGIDELSVINISAVPPDDPTARRLRRILTIPSGQVRLTGNVIDGVLIPDALVYRLS
jgi:hypothetical protein